MKEMRDFMNNDLKPSKFNFHFIHDNYLYLYNSYSGLSDMRKVEKKKIAKIDTILQAQKVDCNIPYAKELYELGYLVDICEDEQNKLEAAYLEYIASPVLHLYILVTEECNFRCLYCYQEHRSIILSQDVQKGIIRFVKKNIRRYTGVHISWFGGEPLLCMDIIRKLSEELIKICKEQRRSYKADITTNGYLLTVPIIKELIKYKVLYYQVTIDGLKDTHDRRKKLKNGSGTYDIIIRNLLNIKQDIHTRTISILIRSNFLESDLTKLSDCIETYYKYFGDDNRFLFAPGGAGDWGVFKIKITCAFVNRSICTNCI